MKNFKFLFLLCFLLFAKLSQAACFPTSFTPESYTYNYTNSASNNVLNSLWLVRFDLTDTDVCRFEFLRGDESVDEVIPGDEGYLKGRFKLVRPDI